jgi:two-component system CheB/CheR fusion protein
VPALPPAIPVVGIGCSAGGLEALERFLSHVPVDCGMAFVIVQHLASDHASALPEILERTTHLPVVEAAQGMLVQADCVYVIPAGRDLSLLRGRLHLTEPVVHRGRPLAIDFFLRSLAEDCGNLAVGVILSGMGSDGVLGLHAIKDRLGLTVAQEPTSAQADSMPSAAIKAGVVDIVATPEDMPARIAGFLRHRAQVTAAGSTTPIDVLSAIDRILALLRDRSGNDFSLYKTNSVIRRIERRMAVHGTASMDDYARLLRSNPLELDLLFKELLIGVTSFFRDADVWNHLRDETLPALFARHPEGCALRAWVLACSTGEEAYSLAMVFHEALDTCRPAGRFVLQVYATDLDQTAIDIARRGIYPASITADVSEQRLARFFAVESGEGYRVVKPIREMVVFATQNAISDPPFTRLDILTCRNFLIYLGGAAKKKIFPLLHYALKPGGLLVLGNAESIGSFTTLFEPLDHKMRIYRQLAQPRRLANLAFPGARPGPATVDVEAVSTVRSENLGQLADHVIQQTWAPPAILVNGDGDILYISGRTGKYLEPAAGKTNMNVHGMAREGLREALTGILRKALADMQPVILRGLRVGSNGSTQVIDLVVHPLDRPEPLRGRLLIVFKDVPAPPVRRRMSKVSHGAGPDQQLALELQQTRQALHATHEEMQSAVEELTSSNEELQSTNEELQSTNEELTTSKEELQSLNEELQTVNAELQSKVEDLTWVRNDMSNLLNSTDIATVFLDNEMKLRRFTNQAINIFRMIPGDIGRPLSHVVTDLDYPQLEADAVDVLRSLAFKEPVVATRDGRWYRVRIMPYRTQDDVIAGIVMTFTDITAIKRLEAKLRAG